MNKLTAEDLAETIAGMSDDEFCRAARVIGIRFSLDEVDGNFERPFGPLWKAEQALWDVRDRFKKK